MCSILCSKIVLWGVSSLQVPCCSTSERCCSGRRPRRPYCLRTQVCARRSGSLPVASSSTWARATSVSLTTRSPTWRPKSEGWKTDLLSPCPYEDSCFWRICAREKDSACLTRKERVKSVVLCVCAEYCCESHCTAKGWIQGWEHPTPIKRRTSQIGIFWSFSCVSFVKCACALCPILPDPHHDKVLGSP